MKAWRLSICMGLASRVSVARIGVDKVQGQQAQERQAAGVQLVLRLFQVLQRC